MLAIAFWKLEAASAFPYKMSAEHF